MSESKQAKHFTDGPCPRFGPHMTEEIMKKCPSVFLVCKRNKNQNVVVYDAMVNKLGHFATPPVEGYWLSLHSDHEQALRKQNIKHNREELGFMDLKFAWGFDAERKSNHECTFKFQQFPKITFHLKIDQDKKTVRAYFDWKQRKYQIKELYIEATDNLLVLRPSDNFKSMTVACVDVTKEPHQPVTLKFGREVLA